MNKKAMQTESVADALGILSSDESHLAIEELRKQFLRMGGIAEAAARLRLTVLDFIEWRKQQILRRPWLWFKRKEYWRKRFDEFCRGRLEQEVTNELWKAIELGKTTFLDLAAKTRRRGD